MRVALVVLLIARAAQADPCELARSQMYLGDLTRAWLQGCADPETSTEIAASADAKGYSRVSVSSDPSGATVEVDAAPDMTFTTPREIYLPPGRWTLTALVDGAPVAQTIVVAKAGASALARLDVPEAASPRDGAVDMSEGGGDVETGPPPAVKFKSMLPDRFQKGGVTEVAGNARVSVPRWEVVVGATTSPGAIVAIDRHFDLGWHLTITPAALLLFDGAFAARGDLTAGIEAGWIAGGGGITVRSDRTIGPVATLEVVHDRWAVTARGERHLGALLVGLRW